MRLKQSLIGATALLVALTSLPASTLAQATPTTDFRWVKDVTAQMTVANITVQEGEDAVFTLILSRPLDFDIRYAYRTEDGTAKAGKDYVAENGLFVIPAGKRFMELPIKTLSDNVIDKNSFKLVLSDPQTYGYGTVWGAYVWTDRWKIEGMPDTKTVRARIRNVAPAGTFKRTPQ